MMSYLYSTFLNIKEKSCPFCLNRHVILTISKIQWITDLEFWSIYFFIFFSIFLFKMQTGKVLLVYKKCLIFIQGILISYVKEILGDLILYKLL